MSEKITRGREYVHPDSYAFVIRDKKSNKILATGWSEEECENEYKKLTHQPKSGEPN